MHEVILKDPVAEGRACGDELAEPLHAVVTIAVVCNLDLDFLHGGLDLPDQAGYLVRRDEAFDDNATILFEGGVDFVGGGCGGNFWRRGGDAEPIFSVTYCCMYTRNEDRKMAGRGF